MIKISLSWVKYDIGIVYDNIANKIFNLLNEPRVAKFV